MKITGGAAVIQSLIQEEVEFIFGYPGGYIMPVYDALCDFRTHIRHVLVRHEQGAIDAAEGYAKATGKPGVCLVTSGPGATNLITGIADAMMDSVPIVCITGQVPSFLLGTDAFQEIDMMSMTASITKWSVQPRSAKEIPAIIAKAFYIAKSGRCGPVVIDLMKDVQLEMIEYSYRRHKKKEPPPLDCTLIKQAALLLNQASRPYILIGQGVLMSGAEEEIRLLAEKGGIPVASTLLGLSAFPSNHSLFVGMLGMYGNYGPSFLSNETDVILAVGMRFDDRVTGVASRYAKQAKIIHIDIDQAELNKILKVTVAIWGDAKKVLKKLTDEIKPKSHPSWLHRFHELQAIEQRKIIDPDLYPKHGQIKMGEAVNCLSQIDKGRSIIVTDVGQHQMLVAKYYNFSISHSHITSGGLGAMGFALPAAIGAKLGVKERQVIVISGDGGFQMNLQELAVIIQEKLAIKIIILNNQSLGMIQQWQKMFYKKQYAFSDLENPDFVKLAEAYDIPGRRVSKRSDLEPALLDLLASETAYLLEILVKKESDIFPLISPGASAAEIQLE